MNGLGEETKMVPLGKVLANELLAALDDLE